jgi:hypothetical protein
MVKHYYLLDKIHCNTVIYDDHRGEESGSANESGTVLQGR